MISIIVPVFNAEKFLPRLIEGLTAQTYKDWEVILVNDGSTDSSGKICDSYRVQDKRLKVIHTNNNGASEARNKGMKIACGEFITFIDADDSIPKNYIQDLMDDYNKSDDADLVIQGMKRKSHCADTNFTLLNKKYNLTEFAEEFFKDVYLNDFSGPYCKLFNTNIIRKYNLSFSKEIIYAEDLDFLLRYIALSKTIYTSQKCNYTYYLNEGSVSTKFYDFTKEMNGFHTLFNTYNNVIEKYPFLSLNRCMVDSITMYIWRVIISNYSFGYSIKDRKQNLKNFTIEELKFIQLYYNPSTLFTKIIKILLTHNQISLLDKLLFFRLSKNK